MSEPDPRALEPRFVAAVDMIGRTGAQNIRIGHTPDEDGTPVVWHAAATWGLDPATGKPMAKGGRITHDAAAGTDPLTAVLRLCEQVIDGGRCAHCQRPTVFIADHGDAHPLDQLGCVYQFDPELATFRRSCEGSDR